MRTLIAALLAAAGTIGALYSAGTASAAVTCFGSTATPVHRVSDDQGVGLIGTDQADVIIYDGSRPSSVLAMAGPDKICTGGSDDNINAGYNGSSDAGSGADRVFSGGGSDTVYGQDRNDVLGGGGGRDALWGHSGDDVLRGGLGNDVLRGGLGNDTCVGNGGTDRFVDCETRRQ